MGLFKKPSTESLDNTARRMNSVGRKVAGRAGGRIGDAVANATVAHLRDSNAPCTCADCKR